MKPSIHVLVVVLVLCSSSHQVPSSASLPLQVVSLLSIKSALTDPHSTFRDWQPLPTFTKPSLENPDWCSWSGVKCDPATSLITSLNLSQRNLSGTIPPKIRYLTGLQHLNLSNNSLSGPLQGAIFELANLRTIDINHNTFVSAFPPGVSKLKLLRVFNAYSNNFTGPLPKEFVELQHLQYLNLGGCFFEGEIPAEYGNFSRLKSLYLQGNHLTGSIPPQLARLTELEHLEIGHNHYSGGIPSELGSLPNLRYLDIVNGSLTGAIPPELGNLRKLETLLVYQNNISGPIPRSFGRMVALQAVDLSMNQITGTLPEQMGSLDELALLNLMINNLTGEIPESISDMKSLAVLQLWNNSLTGSLPVRLGSNGMLSKLDVSSNFLMGQVPPDLCLGNKLEKLILFSNKFTSELPSSLTGCTSLRRLRAEKNMLSGSIPRGLASLPSLNYVDLSWNNFTGLIPDDLGTAPALEYLNISHNSFQSGLPGNLWNAPSLQVLSAASSNLSGQIPNFAACRSFYVIELGGNSFNGTIPMSISHCQMLVCLNLSRNSLTGNIPTGLSQIPGIADVDLSYNSLSGVIPPGFDNCDTLREFNVSYNLLTGPIPSNGVVSQHFHPSAFLGNEGLCGTLLGKPCGVVDSGEGQHRARRTTGAIVWIVVAAFAVGLFLLIAGSRYLHVNYKYQYNVDEERGAGPWKLTAFQRLNFTVDELLECLAISEKVIGMGSSGTVYRAEMPGGDIIAVKKLWGQQKDHIRQQRGILAEVDLLGNVKHRNIVRLLGCCSNRECTMLLYEYMPNGNLDDLLHGKNKAENLMADWLTRYKIALGVAQGICYLHHDCNPAIVHRDVKPSNILLDAEMEARVADFGVAKLIQSNESMSVIAGSYGYIAPEYAYTLRVDEKSDMYSYGVVLMEMLSGRRSVDAEFGEGNSIVEWIRSKIKLKDGVNDTLDKNAGSSCPSVKEEMLQLLKIALLCTSANPADRPSMRDVVLMLQEVRPDRKLAGILDGEGTVGHVQKPAMG